MRVTVENSIWLSHFQGKNILCKRSNDPGVFLGFKTGQFTLKTLIKSSFGSQLKLRRIAIEVLNQRSRLRRCHAADFLIRLATLVQALTHEWRDCRRNARLVTFFVYFV